MAHATSMRLSPKSPPGTSRDGLFSLAVAFMKAPGPSGLFCLVQVPNCGVIVIPAS
jgi:hypothetical protein